MRHCVIGINMKTGQYAIEAEFRHLRDAVRFAVMKDSYLPGVRKNYYPAYRYIVVRRNYVYEDVQEFLNNELTIILDNNLIIDKL